MPAWTVCGCPTTAGGRSTGPCRRWRCCPRSCSGSAVGCRSSSTPACAAGADAFIALALGATAVAIGRPYAYGLGIAGEAGVREVVRNVLAELDITLGLSGHTAVGDVGPDALRALRATGAAGAPRAGRERRPRV